MSTTTPMNPLLTLPANDVQALAMIARGQMFEVCAATGRGHIGGSSSSVETLASLYFGGVLRASEEGPHAARDRVLLRGHLGPIRYVLFSWMGLVETDELLRYRDFGSPLQGHEDHLLCPGVDLTPSGSLGMLLSFGAGLAVAMADRQSPEHVYVLLGDGEEQEGMVSEAARHVGRLGLANLTVILDQNKKQLSCSTTEVDAVDVGQLWQAYGWTVMQVHDGHNCEELIATFKEATQASGPVLIVVETVKGFGIPGCSDHISGYHTVSTCPPNVIREAIQDLAAKERSPNNEANLQRIRQLNRFFSAQYTLRPTTNLPALHIELQPDLATMDDAQLEYLNHLGDFVDRQNIKPYFVTADVTYKRDIAAARLDHWAYVINVGIREQHLFGMVHGIAHAGGSSPVIINSCEAFVLRGLDQINVLSQGGARVLIIDDVAGLTESRNGKSHQGSGHAGAVLSVPDLVLLEPSDATDLAICLNWALSEAVGVVVLRLYSGSLTPIPGDRLGAIESGFYVVRPPTSATVAVIVTVGLMTQEALSASKLLAAEGIEAAHISVLNHKVLGARFCDALPEGVPVLCFYNGRASILQNSVATAICSEGRANRVTAFGFEWGQSGSLSSLLRHYELDARGIASAVRLAATK